MKKLALIGAGGHGMVVREAALISGWDEVIFFDDDAKIIASKHLIGGVDTFIAQMKSYDGVLVSIGNNQTRLAIYSKLQNAGATFATVIHPFSYISESAYIGLGTVVMAGVVVNSKAKIGNGSILNTSCSIDHDCVIEDFVHICPGAHLAGNVYIGNKSWIGIGSSVIENVKIEESVFVAGGSLVACNLAAGNFVKGVPAKPYGMS